MKYNNNQSTLDFMMREVIYIKWSLLKVSVSEGTSGKLRNIVAQTFSNYSITDCFQCMGKLSNRHYCETNIYLARMHES